MNSESCMTMPVVLIVDDDPVCRLFVLSALSKLGYPTLTASNGSEAIQIAQRERPQVIVIDMHLPDMSGIMAMTRLSRLWPDANTDCRFIGLSGDDSPELCCAMQAAGFVSILTKPCTMESLTACVRKIEIERSEVSAALVRNGGPVLSTSKLDLHPNSGLHLQAVFRNELTRQLSELDSMITSLHWKQASEILHRLSGGAALAGFPELASCGRLLLQQLHHAPDAARLAQTYLDLLHQIAELDT